MPGKEIEMQTIILPAGQRNLEGLTLLTAGLERLTGGGKVEIREAIIIETENMPAFWAIQDMLSKDYMKALPAGERAAGQVETILSKPVKALEDHHQQDELKIKEVKDKVHELAKRHYKPRQKIKAAPEIKDLLKRRHQVKAWKVTACAIEAFVGEMFTGQAVRQGLKHGTFPPGTRFHHPKHGQMMIDANHKLIEESI